MAMQLLTKKEAARFTGYHPEHLMRLARAGRFPSPIRLGPTPRCAVRFDNDEVMAWLEERKAERDAPMSMPVAGVA